MTITNIGNLAADLVTLSDAIPAGTTYVAGSTTMGAPLPAVPVAVADTAVGNKMPFDPTSGGTRLVNAAGQPAGVVRTGAANAVVVKFRVTVNATLPLPSSINNTATASYTNVVTGVVTNLQASSTVNVSIPDFGDAPDAAVGVGVGNYRTTKTDNGPRHIIVPGLNLGATPPDADTGLLQGAGATADDLQGIPDDEDAFTTLPALSTSATVYNLSVPLSNSLAVPTTATLYGWLDINKNGRFDGNEAATVSVPSGATNAVLTWVVAGQTVGTTYARFRLTTDVLTNANAATPTLEDTRSFGAVAASNGEVEDYALTIVSGVSVAGRVYADVNANGTAEPTENWTGGPAMFAKLATFTAGTCVAPALSVQPITAPAGTYTFAAVATGQYCIILSNNNLATDVTASVPAGWRNILPSTGIINLTVAALNIINQNFGLFSGSRLSGRVFKDTGNGGGTANDGIQNGAEIGINGVTVTANQAGCAGTVCATAVTDANGDYVMWLPTAVTGALTITETNLSSFLSTGGQVGNTAGTYTRSTDTTAFSIVPGTNYSGVNFADVPENQFLTDGAQSALPGSTLVYPHTFIAGTTGNVAFAVSQLPSPALNTWSEVLYVDANCNAKLDAGEVVVPATTPVTAGQTVCLLVKEFVPAAAPLNAQNSLTVTATFSSTFSGAAVAFNYVRHDITTVGQPTGSGLTLVKSVNVATVLPGGNIIYTVTYTNNSSGIMSNVVISDVTPSYTVFQSASCGVLPLSLTACAIASPAVGATGAISYTMTGTLDPTRSGAVTFTVQVAP